MSFSVIALMFCVSCRTRAGHNQYLEGRERVSEREMRKDKKIIARGNKNYKKQMRANRKHLFGRSTAPPA